MTAALPFSPYMPGEGMVEFTTYFVSITPPSTPPYAINTLQHSLDARRVRRGDGLPQIY